MNLYNIPRHWPPRGDESTGFMTLHGEVAAEFFIPLKGLHEPAWWTGVRFLCPKTEDYAVKFHVKVVDAEGVDVAGTGGFGGSWTQCAGEWQPFDWPIPAAMATASSYQLCVQHNGPANQWITREVAFHELTGLDPRGRYLFTTDCATPCYWSWNGTSKRFDNDMRFHAGYAVHIVPPILHLLNTPTFH